ncbi:MAG: Mth938-like domain-containing protein [Candidatus Nezhaarchaeota archaeon]|nr:Mth938-like domain-containing protein [Candidatus Nezhaarchaeota archaeon]MCX8141194.1 Mth938-like domain-containing protein [Candidatus Nezhaarchaeota archaeon]MDW8049460.1 MTH938/NDUFAF3 family protein [Nitrososphaerota archaeon]
MQIVSYDFGRIVIDGKRYDRDVIITPSEVKSWWRVEGHKVCVKDLEPIKNESFEVLIIGTGYYGVVEVLDEVRGWAKGRGIELIVLPTREACRLYNEKVREKRVVAALHLTC